MWCVYFYVWIGGCNVVMLLCVVIVCVLIVFLLVGYVVGWIVVVVVLVVLVLDGVDGWLVCCSGFVLDFGVCFDMEVDVVFVLVLVLYVWLGIVLGL